MPPQDGHHLSAMWRLVTRPIDGESARDGDRQSVNLGNSGNPRLVGNLSGEAISIVRNFHRCKIFTNQGDRIMYQYPRSVSDNFRLLYVGVFEFVDNTGVARALLKKLFLTYYSFHSPPVHRVNVRKWEDAIGPTALFKINSATNWQTLNVNREGNDKNLVEWNFI